MQTSRTPRSPTKGICIAFFLALLAILAFQLNSFAAPPAIDHPTRDDEIRWFAPREAIDLGPHHTQHEELFGKNIDGYNLAVLRAIDVVQSHALDGDGYFTGPKAQPAESPIGYP